MKKKLQFPLDKLMRIDTELMKEIHSRCIQYGKTFNTGIRDEGSLVQIHTEFLKLVEQKKDMITISSSIIERIIKYHPFWDGNHRTAYELGRFILIIFEHRLDVPLEEAVHFMRTIDDKDLTLKDIKSWIKKRIIPMTEQ
jgi:death-on-curing family protein